MHEAHRQEDQVGLDHLLLARQLHLRTTTVGIGQPSHLFHLHALQRVLLADEAVGGQVPTTDAALFVAAAGLQHHRIHRPGGSGVMAYGRLRHDLDLRHADRSLSVGRTDAIATGITTTDHQDLLALAADPLLRRDLDALDRAVLLAQQF